MPGSEPLSRGAAAGWGLPLWAGGRESKSYRPGGKVTATTSAVGRNGYTEAPPRSGPLPLPLASRSAGAAGPPAQGKKTQSVPRAPLGQTQRPRPVDETGSCVWRSGLNMQASSLMRRIFRAPQEERRSRRGNAPRLRRAASGGLVKIYTFCVFGLVPWAMVW